MQRRTGLPAAVVAATALLAACGDDGSSPTAETAPTSAVRTVSSASTVPAIGSATAAVPDALRFTAPLVGGGEIDAAAYAGQPVLFWFWAPY